MCIPWVFSPTFWFPFLMQALSWGFQRSSNALKQTNDFRWVFSYFFTCNSFFFQETAVEGGRVIFLYFIQAEARLCFHNCILKVTCGQIKVQYWTKANNIADRTRELLDKRESDNAVLLRSDVYSRWFQMDSKWSIVEPELLRQMCQVVRRR